LNLNHNIQMHNLIVIEDHHVNISRSQVKILRIQHNHFHQHQTHEKHDHIYRLNVQEVLDEVDEIIYEIRLDQDVHRDYHGRIFYAMCEFHPLINLLK
jgi:hypothetical protein